MLAGASACVCLAAVARVVAPFQMGQWVAAGLWTTGFVLFVPHFAPILMAPNVTRTAANSAANQNTRLVARTIGHTFVIVAKITHRMQIGISRATPFHLAPKRSDPAA